MIKIAFIGAGSIGFTRTILADILTVPELKDRCGIAFHDISKQNLDMVYRLCSRDMESNGVKSALTATLDRRTALKDASYVFCVVRVGGLEAFRTDIDIPLKYGVDQCVGDTLCAGGIMYAQRTIPVLLDICRDIREVAKPGCRFISHVNPMAMNVWACTEYGSGVETIGLCHGVENGVDEIARALDVPREEIDYVCAGINHQTWYISIKHKGKDMTGKLLEAFEKHPVLSRTEKVRIDLMRRFGYYSTESNGHAGEYVAWYRKRPDEITQWIDLSSWINGETGGYLRVCTEGRTWFETDFPNWMKAPPLEYSPENRSREHGGYIVESLETGRPYRGHFNVRNSGCITNLPQDCIVESPGWVDGTGLSMCTVGSLPLGCAAVCNASITVQRLSVEAAVTGDDTLLTQAMMLDPLTGAVCTPPEIRQMTDEMLAAQEQWLPQYGDAAEAAKKRLSAGDLISTRRTEGAARRKVKTVEEMAADAEKARASAGAADKAEPDRSEAPGDHET